MVWFGSVPVVPAACKDNALLGADGCKTNGIYNFNKIHFWKASTAKCATQKGACIPYATWSTDFVAVVGKK